MSSTSGIFNYSGPVIHPPFNVDSFTVGTAFEILLGDVVWRRGIKLPAYQGRDPAEQFWFARMSAIRATGESQDLRSLLCSLPMTRVNEMCIRPLPVDGNSFDKWLSTIPRPVRNLAGHPPPPNARVKSRVHAPAVATSPSKTPSTQITPSSRPRIKSRIRVPAVFTSTSDTPSTQVTRQKNNRSRNTSWITNYSGPMLHSPFNQDDIPVGTAFEIVQGKDVIRRGIKLTSTYCEVDTLTPADPQRQFWYLHISQVRDGLQDLRPLMCTIPAVDHPNLFIRGLDISLQSFRNWLSNVVPLPVRDIHHSYKASTTGEQSTMSKPTQKETDEWIAQRRKHIAKRISYPLMEAMSTVEESLASETPSKRKRPFSAQHDPVSRAQEMLHNDEYEELPLFVRVSVLEDRQEYMTRCIRKTVSSLRKLLRE